MVSSATADRMTFYSVKALRWIERLIDTTPDPEERNLLLGGRQFLTRMEAHYRSLRTLSNRGTHATSGQTQP